MPDDSLCGVDFNSERIMSVSLSVPEIFDVTIGKMHYVIIAIITSYYNHYVIIGAFSAYYLFRIFNDISKS